MKIDVKNELQSGMIVQSGVVVAEIINDESNLEVELIIPDKDIGKLKINQDIKYNIQHLFFRLPLNLNLNFQFFHLQNPLWYTQGFR